MSYEGVICRILAAALTLCATGRADDPLCPLTYGVDGIVTWDGLPGPLIVGGTWTSLAFSDFYVIGDEWYEPAIVAAGRQYGPGRVVALGHEWFFGGPDLSELDNEQFGRNIVCWLDQDNTGEICVRETLWSFTVEEGLLEVLASEGYQIRVIPQTEELSPSDIEGCGVLVVCHRWDPITSNEIYAVEDFVEDGGGLWLFGLGWSYRQYVDPNLGNFPMNQIGARFGVRFEDGSLIDLDDYVNDCWCHPIFETLDLGCSEPDCGPPFSPQNDDCQDSMAISDGETWFSTRDATTDGPTPVDCEDTSTQPFEADVWHDYVATCSGTLTVNLCEDTEYDAMLAVYGDESATCLCPVDDAYQLAAADDTCGDPWTGVPPIVSIPVCEGNCYKIRIGGWWGATGNGTINITCEPTFLPSGTVISGHISFRRRNGSEITDPELIPRIVTLELWRDPDPVCPPYQWAPGETLGAFVLDNCSQSPTLPYSINNQQLAWGDKVEACRGYTPSLHKRSIQAVGRRAAR